MALTQIYDINYEISHYMSRHIYKCIGLNRESMMCLYLDKYQNYKKYIVL